MTKKEGKGPEAYIRQVQESTQRYALDLLFENEKLRSLAASLQAQRKRLEEQLEQVRGSADEARAEAAARQLERHRLELELAGARDEASARCHEQLRLQDLLANTEAQGRRLTERYVQVEQQNSNLASLYVASYRLHETLERDEVLATLREILVNLVGTEEFAVFEREPTGALRAVASMGVDPARWAHVSSETSLARRVEQGEPGPWAGANDEEAFTALVPLRMGNEVVGAIAVFRLLPHKPGLEQLDQELFELLASHAATALYCSRAPTAPLAQGTAA